MTMNPFEERKTFDLAALRQRVGVKRGRDYWRSLNELADSEEFDEIIEREFPRQAGMLDTLNRRDFLKVLGAALALAGMTACVPEPQEKILPYVNPPEAMIPGKSVYYASAMVEDGYARGVLIETTMGRPIKVEGNPLHPGSLGASDVFMQASILDLYDPERAHQIKNGGVAKTWQDFTAAIGAALAGGAGLRILSGPVTSPSLTAQIQALLAKYPGSKWVIYSPTMRSNTLMGARAAFGQPYEPVYNFSKADVVLSLDCDFMVSEPGSLRYSHDFAARHQPISANGTMNRLYMVESSATLTGAAADHHLSVKPSQVEAFARAVASRLGVNVPAPSGTIPGQSWLDALAADLKKAGPAALVLAGERQPAAVHALAHAMNQALGAIGNTVNLLPPVVTPDDPAAGLAGLVQELNSGAVTTLVILDGNPVYSAPADLDFAAAMKKAKTSVYLAYHEDETAAQATWVIPAAHYMEMWSDARAYDGTASIIQPVILPLYGGKSPHELVAALGGAGDAKGLDLLRAFWQGQMKSATNFDAAWRDLLSKGIAPDTAGQAATNLPQATAAVQSGAASGGAPDAGALEIVFEADPTTGDGRYANNAWLQELPKPLTKLTWDNVALFSPATAQRLGVKDGDVVTLKLRGRSVDAPALTQPGQPDDVVGVTLGYGRKAGGRVLEGTGFNAYAIRPSTAPWFDGGLEVARTGGTYPLALTHEHFSMENRDLVREATLSEYQSNPKFAQLDELYPQTLYNETFPSQSGYSWGMAINLSACIGCNACVVACQAENNIPSVGKDQVTRGREMHWLRIDRYYKGDPNQVQATFFEPVPCMHCEKAPCEPVCPVEATSHSSEGLNEMTYNRCVGTRYCSNNCPYKVRRFNFYKYQDFDTEPYKAMRNPNVSVRMRGVMEKCTYCVQRINRARITSEEQGRTIQDGEVKTACQQACPTNAIVFGNIADPGSAVSQQKATPLNYGLLADLGTRPRTTYLGKVTNPNPNIKEQA